MPITLTTGAMTELDAVNAMLLSIGQAPVNTLEVSNIKDVSFARLILNNTSRSVQTRGWSFNTDHLYSLVPDVSGNILMPADALVVDCEDKSLNVSWRNGMLYDGDENTSVFTATDLEFRVVRFMPFEDMPQPARDYIAMKAARSFQAQIVGSQILYSFTKEMEIEAQATFMQSERRQKDTNLFSGTARTNNIFTRRR
jgi:hypothetical protein